jgi:CheY-like chemotaxis protein
MAFTILLADDQEEDHFLMQRALGKAGVEDAVLKTVFDGLETVKYLSGEGIYCDRSQFPFPNVVLTDLKMPKLDGFGFLRWARSHPECVVIPTIVFSSSGIPGDVKMAYELGANAYLVKPHGLQQLVDLVRLTYQFWSHCEIPPPPPYHKCSEAAAKMV